MLFWADLLLAVLACAFGFWLLPDTDGWWWLGGGLIGVAFAFLDVQRRLQRAIFRRMFVRARRHQVQIAVK